MLKITEALIVNGVIIANGVADSDGDVLTKKDIKTIFMKYQRDTDTMHTNIKNFGVEVFASWISEVDTIINGRIAPEGSWLATLKVTNEKIVQCIKEGKLKGFSLGSVSDKAYTPKYWFINKSLTYNDIKDIEEVIPLFISFVDKPANQYDFEVMTYDAYINKNEKDVEEMTENKEEMISISALEKVKDLFGINKSENDNQAEETANAESSTDETVSALFEKIDSIIEQNNQIIEQNNAILEGINKTEEVDEEEEIEKAEEDKSEEETETASEDKKEEEDDAEIEKEETSEEEDKKEEKEEEDDAHIDKRETSMVENQITSQEKTFYQKTGRDSFGRKIKI